VREAPLRFLRKHYFYPDLPSNYQRTGEPFATGGSLLGVPLREVHWEEDPGAYDPRAGTVDFNRSGAPLIEVVTEPEVRSAEHARQCIEELRLLLQYLGALSPAGMKADANISLAGGERVEVKNLNSARNVELALLHEAERQGRALDRGLPVARETRHFDEAKGATLPLRAKESEEDYRHLRDPDLPGVDVAPALRAARASLPPSPFDLREAWQRELGATREAAEVVLGEPGMAAAFLALPAEVRGRDAFEFLVGDLKRELNFRQRGFAASGIGAEELAELLRARHAGLPRARAVGLVRVRLDEGAEAFRRALQAEGKGADDAAVEEAVRAAIEANPRAVEDWRAGKEAALHRIMGDAMKRLQGRVPPAELRARILAALGPA
jgi:aspartyl-tRNA(Asn)/glutamyl-tRNA(Gln) amidotransferase subunit B